MSRNPFNDRGDPGSIKDRVESVESVGVLEIKAAWLVQSEDPSNSEDFTAIHSATLCTGFKIAARRDKNKSNKSVQLSDRNGLKHCKIYRRGIYEAPECLIHLKEMGNKTNSTLTAITPLEIMRSSEVAQTTFQAMVTKYTWSMSSLGGAPNWNAKRFEIANALYQDRWADAHALEICHIAYKRLVTHTYDFQGVTVTAWDRLQKRCAENADFSKLQPIQVNKVIKTFYDVTRFLLSEEPELCLDLCMMAIPVVSGHGKCQLLPNGLPLLTKVAESSLISFLKPLRDQNAIVVQHNEAEKEETKKKGKAKAKAGKKGSGATKDPSPSSGARNINGASEAVVALATAAGADEAALERKRSSDEVDINIDPNLPLISHLREEFRRMKNLDPSGRQSQKVDSFYMIAIYGVANNGVTIYSGSVPKMIKGWSRLRAIMKATILKSARLKARPSDIDADLINNGELDELFSQNDREIIQLRDKIAAHTEEAQQVWAALHDVEHGTMPIMAIKCTPTMLNQTMTLAMAQVARAGGAFPSQRPPMP